ncbi:MAG: MjaI family restriction endonuclease [Candidatus Woesearchaeota archaeon]|nr:MjaI family restriction endonuclease [Candidatus Woesearchaeota archaeon]
MNKKEGIMFKIKNNELIVEISGEAKIFPKYTTQIINLANQNSQGTRPKVVGQLSELIQKCPHKEYSKWKEWYLQQQPKAIDNATEKVFAMVEEFKKTINQIDKAMVRLWIRDLVIDKTFIGLKFQEAILKRVAKMKNTTYRLSNPQEESKGIDGYIGKEPVSIKPITYKTKNMLNEKIDVKFIFYDKKKDGINVDISQLE